MSDQPEDNPYANRSHDEGKQMDRSDVHAVAALIGNVAGSLKEVDRQYVGGDSNAKALRIDPKKTLKDIITSTNTEDLPAVPLPSDVHQNMIPQTNEIRQAQTQPRLEKQVKAVMVTDEIEARLSKLEQRVFRKQFKFKRGIAYNINTINIKGTFRDPDDILEIVQSELAKQVKSITIKLDGTNKNTK